MGGNGLSLSVMKVIVVGADVSNNWVGLYVLSTWNKRTITWLAFAGEGMEWVNV